MNSDDGCPKWFKRECEDNLDDLRQRKGTDVDRPDHVARREQVYAQPPLRERWEYYQDLLRQQNNVLAAESDEDAFLYGVKQFPAPRKVPWFSHCDARARDRSSMEGFSGHWAKQKIWGLERRRMHLSLTLTALVLDGTS
ncbi:uncharacterized protein ASPGLDRAFT_31751 [Aspergillus glaucus CBS 516.65]|uniref:Uncharacterized protein n=1 Tax=Aspergillus glaucus CBS 516.65 TaxID=1160497 RepID=A0A1L9VXM3_ASPGL|nr:hypothetical protein ASPGLDRAFT_31751 [Aspergillus glaucus CBS 516.65]OJJ88627.1 hypothetical protein ASPGLDRAFT_31751 [Aspergillus glaucus CBS 516.65]